MATVGQGGTHRWSISVQNWAGIPTDASTLTITVRDPSTSIVDPFPIALVDLVHDDTGEYHLDWDVEPDQDTGTYAATWEGSIPDGPLVPVSDYVEVVPPGSLSVRPIAGPPVYLTPGQFRAMNLGVSLTGWTDLQLAAYLRRASSSVNNFTGAPRLPVVHDFRGGEVAGETHTWPVDAYDTSPTRKVFLYHRPVIAIASMRIYATKTQYVEFQASELYYELSEGWVEPASANLTSYGLWGAAMYPAIGLSEPHSSIDYTYGDRFPSIEMLYPDTVTNQWRSTVGWWSDETVQVYVNGVLRTSAYTIDRNEGTVLFSSPIPNSNDDVEVSFTGRLHPDIAMATGIIAAARINDKNLVAAGFPQGVRSFRVAEVQVERDLPRRGASQPEPESIPNEAAELLEQFRFAALAFA